MKKITFIVTLILTLTFSKDYAQLLDIDQWWVTFGVGNAFEGFTKVTKGINMGGNINVHSGNYFYQVGFDNAGVPVRSDKSMSSYHFDLGQTIIDDYYMLNGFGGLGIMNYAYSDSNSKLHNVITVGINLNAQIIVKPFTTFGLGIEPFINLRYHHTVSGLMIVLMLGDGI